MKKFFDKIKNKANSLAVSAKTTLANAKAEGYIDTGVKIIIGVVVKALIGVVSMRSFTASLVGVVPCRLYLSFASSMSTFPNCGRSCADGMTALGGSFALTIRCVSWRSALRLRQNGVRVARASVAELSIML